MKRRDLISGATMAAVAGLFANSALAAEPATGHMGHGKAKGPMAKAKSPQLLAAIDTANKCLPTGQACLAHCTDNLAAGDASMADCQRSVMNMLALCQALSAVASYNSAPVKDIKALAKSCADFCRLCAKNCEPHAEHHAECKNCRETCLDCAKACDAYVKA